MERLGLDGGRSSSLSAYLARELLLPEVVVALDDDRQQTPARKVADLEARRRLSEVRGQQGSGRSRLTSNLGMNWVPSRLPHPHPQYYSPPCRGCA